MASESSEAVANRLLDDIQRAADRLLQFPFSGAARDHFAHGLRVTFASSYAVYYLVSAHEIVLVRVFHGARDAAAIALRGGFE